MRSCDHLKYYKFETKLYATVYTFNLDKTMLVIANYLRSLTCSRSYCRYEYILSLSNIFIRICLNINIIINKDDTKIEPLTNILKLLLDCGARLPVTPEFTKNLYKYPAIIKMLLPYTAKKFGSNDYEFLNCSANPELAEYISKQGIVNIPIPKNNVCNICSDIYTGIR